MSEAKADRPLRLALQTGATLTAALEKLLNDIPGLKLVDDPAFADAVLIAAPAAAGGEEFVFTPREYEVLSLMAEGASNREIAEALAISVRTAKFHVSRIIDKLDATGRTDAVAHAARMGVIRL
jgi:DNA-binding CsgD family transcriptional regulator